MLRKHLRPHITNNSTVYSSSTSLNDSVKHETTRFCVNIYQIQCLKLNTIGESTAIEEEDKVI